MLTLALAATSSVAAENPTADVIGGSVVSQSSYDANYPWMVGLLQANDPESFFCGGSLIAPTWVLTAAHCKELSENVDPKYIVIGRADLLDGTHGEIIPVTASYQHPGWDAENIRNDLMLLKLSHAPAVATPIPLATAGDDPAAGATANVSGWGIFQFSGTALSADLRHASLDVYSNSACESEWGNSGIITSAMICAIHKAGASSRLVCSGDSGGPLQYGGRQVGIVSFGSVASDGKTCNTTAASVFTRVSSFNSYVSGFMQKVLAPTVQKLTFPNTLVDGATSVLSVTYRSDGDNPVSVIGLGVSGDYAIVSNTCSGVVPVGAACTVGVQFDPTANGTRTGVLTLNTDSPGMPAATVNLSGLGFGALGAKPNLHIKQKGRAKRSGGRLRAVFTVSFLVPNQSTPKACAGAVRTSITTPKVKKPTVKSTAVIWNGKSCNGTVVLRLPVRAKNHKVKAKLSFPGNLEMAPGGVTRTLTIR